MDSQHTKTVDFDAIYNVQLDFINDKNEWWKKNNYFGVSLNVHLRDSRTIHMGGPRQSGKSQWSYKQLKEDQHTSMVVVNDSLRNVAIANGKVSPQDAIRIFTVHEIKKFIKDDELPYIGKRIILDDALYIFDRLDFISFYKWIALKQDWDLHIIKIS